MRNLLRLRLLIIGLVVATGWSCTETIVGIVDIATVEIEPAAATVYVDADVRLQARLKDERGNTLSGRQLEWSSEQPQIATVDGDGLVRGVSAGDADIVASSEGVRRTARVAVIPRPVITTDPDSVVFTLVRGGIPAPTDVAITNTGGGTLANLAVAAQYDGAVTGWLDTTLSASDAPATLTLVPAADDLPPGSYRASVRITAPDAANTPVTLNVRLDLLRADPAHVAVLTGDGQSAMAGTAVSNPIGVAVTDANGNGVEGVAVSFTIASGGGSLADDEPVSTDDDGMAMAPAWTLGSVVGSNTLKATADGLADASVTITATAVPGAPSQLTIETEPSASSPSGSAFARQPVVQLRDVGGNAVSRAGVAVTATIVSGGGILDGGITITTDATGAARFTDLAIIGEVGERTLEFSAERLTPARSSAIAVTTGAGTQLSIVTQPSASAPSGVAFARQPSLQLQDAGGNPVAQAGILVVANITNGGGTLGGSVTATTNASGITTFTDLRISGTVGDRTLSFTASGITAATSDAVSITVGPPSAAHTTAVVPNGTAGAATSITITMRDDGGNAVTGEAARLAVAVSGANTSAPAIDEAGAGEYSASYTPTASGTDQVSITLNGAPIAGSPFTSTIAPSGVSVSNSSVTLSPTGSVTANGQDTVTVTVVLRDAIGNPIGGLTGSIEVSLSGSASAGAVAETSTEGTYMFTLTSTVANVVGLVLTVGGVTLSDQPSVEFEAGPIAIATSAVGASPATGVAANGIAASTVTIVLADAFTNPITGLTETDFNIVLSGSAVRSGVTESGPAGTYVFTVTNEVAETITVTVSAGGVALNQTPQIEFVAGSVSGTLSSAAANPTTDVTADGTTFSTVTVTLVDDLGNPITGLADGSFAIGLGETDAVSGTVTEDVGTPGTYTFNVTNTTAESVTVTVTASGVTLTTTPTITFVAGDVSATVSTATSDPTTGVQADGIEASTVTVMLKDANGNAIAGLAAGDFVIDLPANAVATTVTEGAGGTYTFDVTSTTAQLVTVTITADGTELQPKPTIDFVAGGPSASLSTATANPALDVTADGEAESTVTVTLMDSNSNPITGLDAGDFGIVLTGTAAVKTAISETTTPGTYSFTVTNTTAETVTVTVTATEVTLTNTPTITFVAGAVNAANSSVTADPGPVVTSGGGSD